MLDPAYINIVMYLAFRKAASPSYLKITLKEIGERVGDNLDIGTYIAKVCKT